VELRQVGKTLTRAEGACSRAGEAPTCYLDSNG